MAQGLCERKYQCELAKQTVLLLKERIAKNRLPAAFDALDGSLPFSFVSLHDYNLFQQLRDRQREIMQEHRRELLRLFLATTEAKRDESKRDFDQAMAQFWREQRTVPEQERLTDGLIAILERRVALITTRLDYVYQYHHERLLVPTSTHHA